MSEYQYYEFQAVDRPLTADEMGVLRSYSTRADISRHKFTNVYHWGSFKGNPREWVENYFDAYLYNSNFGSCELKLRVPRALLDLRTVLDYCSEEACTYYEHGEYGILSFNYNTDDYGGWVDEEDRGRLDALLPIRVELMQGDYRALYLGWLHAVEQYEVDDAALEPPVPANLGKLTVAQEGLAEFMDISDDLIVAAAEMSPQQDATGLSTDEINQWIAKLSNNMKHATLYELISGQDPHLRLKLQQRIMAQRAPAEQRCTRRRTAGELVARAKDVRQVRLRKAAEIAARKNAEEKRAAAAARANYLASLVGKENTIWGKIEALINTKRPADYDEAVCLITDLSDLAAQQGQSSQFLARLNELCQEHARKSTLMRRITDAKLLKIVP